MFSTSFTQIIPQVSHVFLWGVFQKYILSIGVALTDPITIIS